MGDIAQSVRPSKRDAIVIDNGESTNDQPVTKSVKMEVEEESFTSSQLAELQQQVLKLEDKLQRAYRAAGEYKERAEAAENRLDSKYGIKEGLNDEKKRADDLERRLADVSSRLDAAKRRAENSFAAKVELARENDVLKMELAELKRVTGKKHGSSLSNDQHDKVTDLRNQLEEVRRRGNEDRSRYRSKIDELTERLADAAYTDAVLAAMQHPALLPNGAFNLLRLCRADTNEMVSYEKARADLLSVVNESEGETANQFFAKLPKLKNMVLQCEACNLMLNKSAIFTHFLGKGHEKKVRAQNANVCVFALKFWMDVLKPFSQSMQQQSVSEAAGVAGRPMQQPGDAAVSDSQPTASNAASSNESEAPKEIKEEEIDD